jgi:hypothetical protein
MCGLNCPTVGVTGAGAGVDSVWEQEQLEATLHEMLAVGAARREAAVPSVQCITLALGPCQGYPGDLAGRFVGRRARPRLSGEWYQNLQVELGERHFSLLSHNNE